MPATARTPSTVSGPVSPGLLAGSLRGLVGCGTVLSWVRLGSWTRCWVLKEHAVRAFWALVSRCSVGGAGGGFGCGRRVLFLTGPPFITSLGVLAVSGVGCLVVGSGLGCCSLLENYTVDASIFVAKLLRAHGGCLGIRSR